MSKLCTNCINFKASNYGNIFEQFGRCKRKQSRKYKLLEFVSGEVVYIACYIERGASMVDFWSCGKVGRFFKHR